MRPRYPFDALHWLRQERVERQATLVTESAARAERARAEEVRAQAARHKTELAIEQLAEAELASLDEGQLRAGDLQVVADWRKGAAAELRNQTEIEQAAREARVREAAAELEARQALGSASSQAQMIDSHRSSFRSAQAARADRTDEEAAQEQWTARHFPPRRR